MEDKNLNTYVVVRQPLIKYLGVELVELDPDRVVITMPVDERHYQPTG